MSASRTYKSITHSHHQWFGEQQLGVRVWCPQCVGRSVLCPAAVLPWRPHSSHSLDHQRLGHRLAALTEYHWMWCPTLHDQSLVFVFQLGWQECRSCNKYVVAIHSNTILHSAGSEPLPKDGRSRSDVLRTPYSDIVIGTSLRWMSIRATPMLITVVQTSPDCSLPLYNCLDNLNSTPTKTLTMYYTACISTTINLLLSWSIIEIVALSRRDTGCPPVCWSTNEKVSFLSKATLSSWIVTTCVLLDAVGVRTFWLCVPVTVE